MICYQRGSDQEEIELSERLQASTSDQIFYFKTNCSNGTRNPYVLLCGNQNSSTDLTPCQKCSNITSKPSTATGQMMCTNYNQNNLEAVARLLIPRDLESNEVWNALLIFCEFYSQDNLINLVEQLIIDNFVDVTTITTVTRYSALTLLCRYHRSDKMVRIAQLFIEQGADVHHQDVYGYNALTSLMRWSESEKILQVAELLINMGVDVNQVNGYHDNGLMLLCHYSKSDKILQLAKLLLAKGIDVNQINLSYGQNALIELCQNSRNENMFQVAELLITEGIDVNLTNRYGLSAVDYLNQRSDKVANKHQIIQMIQNASNKVGGI